MSTELNERVSKLEFRADATDKQLAILEKTGDGLRKALEGVQATLQQLKWLGYGAAIMFVAQQLGFVQALKLLMGLHS